MMTDLPADKESWLELSVYDQAVLEGEHGPAAQLAMSIVTRMARVFDAPALMDISGAHIDSTIYIGEAGLEFAERLAGLGAQVVVPTTLNVSGVDERGWQDWAVPRDWAEKARRQMVAYQGMGCAPTWTCAPYQTELRPAFGQQVAWVNPTPSSSPTRCWGRAPSATPTCSISAAPSPAGCPLAGCTSPRTAPARSRCSWWMCR